jgi:hypothetical protein
VPEIVHAGGVGLPVVPQCLEGHVETDRAAELEQSATVLAGPKTRTETPSIWWVSIPLSNAAPDIRTIRSGGPSERADAMPGVIHLTTDRRFRGSRRGVIVHQAHLAEGDVTWRDGIPVTTPLRTVTDVATDQSVAVAAVTEAIERGLLRAHQLRKAAEDRPVLAELLSRMPSE